MNNTNISTILVFLVFIVLAWMLVGMYDKKVTIIEEKPEDFNPMLEGWEAEAEAGPRRRYIR